MGYKSMAVLLHKGFGKHMRTTFLLLSGYLLCEKRLGKHYYIKIIRVLILYILSSCICIFFKALVLKMPMNGLKPVLRILDYSGAQYAWYVNMYIGLFLIIPFLNILWNSCTDRQRKLLVIISLVLTTVPATLNIFNFEYNDGFPDLYFWANSRINTYNVIVPDYWKGNYAILYFIVGAYLKKYRKEVVKTKWLLLFFTLDILGFGSLLFIRNIYSVFITTDPLVGWQNVFTVSSAVLLFEIIYRVNMKKWPCCIKKGLTLISQRSFTMFLISYITDKLIYARLVEITMNVLNRVWLIPIAVISVCVISFLLASPVELIGNKVYLFIKKRLEANDELV